MGKLQMVISLIVNLVLSAAKIFVGIVSNSHSITSDGFHSLSDLITDIVALVGISLSNKKEDDKHPFGHGKFEYITSLMVGFLILFFSYELFMHVISGENVVPNITGIYVIIATIVIKLLLSSYLINKGKKFDNQILMASGRESLNDVYSSVIVLVGLLLTRIDFAYNVYVDKAFSIIIVLMILRTGLSIIKENINLLLGVNVDKEVIKELENEVLKNVKDVIRVDKFILLKYGPCYKAIIDIQVDKKASVLKGHNIGREVKKVLLDKEKINYVKIHVEPYNEKEQ
jgi:cation diffusion facilitator family transporter